MFLSSKSLNGKSRSGSIIVLTVFAAIFMLGMTALVTDVGYLYYNKARLQTAVNAGWKAGYDKMIQLKGSNPTLTISQQAIVRNHVAEVIQANGYSPSDLKDIQITFGTGNNLEVRSTADVGLFFARAMDFNSAEVGAGRQNHPRDSGQGIVPLAIPHGVTKDLSRSFYNVHMFGENEGFKEGEEYILKLGTGQGLSDQTRLLVPMDDGSQSTGGFRRAYGAAYWCLQINESDGGHFAPVHWLLGYRGGAFILMDDPIVKNLLSNYGVNYEVISGNDNINAIYEAVGPNVMEIHNRPRIAVYSSTTVPDPVETVLRNARIPYGPYSLPGNWPRGQAFNTNNCSSLYDEAVLDGEVNKYHWLHLHHEDFTGFSGGCRKWRNSPANNNTDPDCRQNLNNGLYGPTDTSARRTTAKEFLCDYCYSRYNTSNGVWGTGAVTITIRASSPNITAAFDESGTSVTVTTSSSYVRHLRLTFDDNTTQNFGNYSSGSSRTVSGSGGNSGKLIKQVRVQLGSSSTYYYGTSTVVPYVQSDCRHYQRRCAEFATYRWWQEYENIKPAVPSAAFDQYIYRNSSRSQVRDYVCFSDDTRPNCRGYNRIYDIATNFGYTDDSNSVPKPKRSINNNGSTPLSLTDTEWFRAANRVQKMKWEVAEIVKQHVNSGGFLFAQCFAPETFDIALFQKGIYDGLTAAEAYNRTLAFTNFQYAALPIGNVPLKFSTINSRESGTGNQPLTTYFPTDPRTQNHSTTSETGSGHTASFMRDTVKSGLLHLGIRSNDNNMLKYVGGDFGNGIFSFLGGHYHYNLPAERLVLNNILFGSTSTKEVSEGSETNLSGRRKHSYGPIDPDNIHDDAVKVNDYQQRFLNGYNEPMQISDRVNVEPNDNMASPTQVVVDTRINGLEDYPVNRRVIVPITDVGPEININSIKNADAMTIYDIQGRDNATGIYDPTKYGFESSVRIIGFAEFEIIGRDEYTRNGIDILEGDSGDLGSYQTGQVRGKFIRYVVKPGEVPVN